MNSKTVKEILRLQGSGLTNQDIAKRFCVPLYHVFTIYRYSHLSVDKLAKNIDSVTCGMDSDAVKWVMLK